MTRGVLVLWLALFATSSANACAVERARYALRGAPEITAKFWVARGETNLLTNVMLHIDSRKQRDHFWFAFDWGSGRFTHLISTTPADAPGWTSPTDGGARPLPSDMTIWFADQRYDMTYTVPRADQPAPAHFFIPEFEETMWYDADPRRGVPSGFFDLVRCG